MEQTNSKSWITVHTAIKNHIETYLSNHLRFKVELHDKRYKLNQQANYLSWSKLEELTNSIINLDKKYKRKKISYEIIIDGNLNVEYFNNYFLIKKTIQDHYYTALFFILCYAGTYHKVLPSVYNILFNKAKEVSSDKEWVNKFKYEGNIFCTQTDFTNFIPIDVKSPDICPYSLPKEVNEFFISTIKICSKYKCTVKVHLVGNMKDYIFYFCIFDGDNKSLRYTAIKYTLSSSHKNIYTIENYDLRKKVIDEIETNTFTLTNIKKLMDKWFEKIGKKS